MNAVELTDVDKTFDTGTQGTVHALSGIGLRVEPGEFVSLIGPSGCGKSTLLRVVADLEQPSAGSVVVGGKSARQARLDQDYGIAFQQSGLLEWRTVAANVELPLHVHGVAKAERRAGAAELLALVGLADFAARARRSAFATPCTCKGSSTFAATVRHSSRPDCWNAMP